MKSNVAVLGVFQRQRGRTTRGSFDLAGLWQESLPFAGKQMSHHASEGHEEDCLDLISGVSWSWQCRYKQDIRFDVVAVHLKIQFSCSRFTGAHAHRCHPATKFDPTRSDSGLCPLHFSSCFMPKDSSSSNECCTTTVPIAATLADAHGVP